MTWYRLNIALRSAELDAKLDEYRDFVQGAIARLGGRDMTARVYCERGSVDATVFIEIVGQQPSWLMLRMMRFEIIEAPPSATLELLGEVANGRAVITPDTPGAAGGIRSV